jgi:hypothetical protein
VAGLGTLVPQASLSAAALAVMDRFLTELKSKADKKKPPGLPAVFGRSGRLL